MKPLENLFDRVRPTFEDEGLLSPFEPVFEATENFFLSPGTPTDRAPHVRDPMDLKRYMWLVVLALLPALFCGLYFFGLRVLAVVVVSYAVGGSVEVVFAMARNEEISEGFLVTGLLFPLVLPPAVPLWMVGMGVAFGVLVGKELFGGTGRNLFNPALVGRCFLAIAYPAAMAGGYLLPGDGLTGRLAQYVGGWNADAVSSATPLAAAKQGTYAALSDLFFGHVSGSIGETSALALVAGGLFLLATRVANWRTVVGVLGTFGLLGLLLSRTAPETFGPIGWHMLAGGLLLGAFFMATDPVTSPAENGAKWAYGAIVGACALLIRHLTGYVEGVMFAILLGNIAAPVLDEVAVRAHLRRLSDEG
ncbi:MAG: RnfABCDGE type electron transport complex subunit D [Planctomycetota bacterium]